MALEIGVVVRVGVVVGTAAARGVVIVRTGVFTEDVVGATGEVTGVTTGTTGAITGAIIGAATVSPLPLLPPATATLATLGATEVNTELTGTTELPLPPT